MGKREWLVMAKILVKSPTGKLLFEDPGDMMAVEETETTTFRPLQQANGSGPGYRGDRNHQLGRANLEPADGLWEENLRLPRQIHSRKRRRRQPLRLPLLVGRVGAQNVPLLSGEKYFRVMLR